MRFATCGDLIGMCCLVMASFGTAFSIGADESTEFFEQKIRPVLVDRCYSCHSAKAAAKKTLKGGLLLDTREALRKGGESGPAIVPGKPQESLLIAAIRHESIEMPPKEKLPDQVIADFVKWVQMGAPDPRDGSATAATGIDIAAARRSWAYQAPKARLPTRTGPAATSTGCCSRLLKAIAYSPHRQPIRGLSFVARLTTCLVCHQQRTRSRHSLRTTVRKRLHTWWTGC